MPKIPLFARILAILTLCIGIGGSALGQGGQRLVPLGFCAISSLSSSVGITTSNCVFSTFTGSITTTALVTTGVTGAIVIGQQVIGGGASASTYVIAQVSGTLGGAGTYTVSVSQTSSPTNTAGIPQGVTYAVICAASQAVNYRDDGGTPTNTVGTGGQTIPAGVCIGYTGTNFANLKFIEQAASATLSLSFYR